MWKNYCMFFCMGACVKKLLNVSIIQPSSSLVKKWIQKNIFTKLFVKLISRKKSFFLLLHDIFWLNTHKHTDKGVLRKVLSLRQKNVFVFFPAFLNLFFNKSLVPIIVILNQGFYGMPRVWFWPSKDFFILFITDGRK